jgi:hypothetical protein
MPFGGATERAKNSKSRAAYDPPDDPAPNEFSRTINLEQKPPGANFKIGTQTP